MRYPGCIYVSGVFWINFDGGKILKKNKNKKAAAVKNTAAIPENEVKKEYVDIHEKASGIPESLAEDLSDAITDVRERVEEHREKDSSASHIGMRGIIIVVVIGVVLYWLLDHARAFLNLFGMFIDVISPITVGGCIAFVLNLVLMPLERAWDFLFGKIGSDKVRTVSGRFKRPVCLIISTIIMFGVVLGLFLIIIPELIVTVKMFIDMIPSIATKTEHLITDFSDFLSKYDIKLPAIKLNTEEVMSLLNSFLAQRGQQMIDTTVNFTTSLFSTLFDSILSFVFAFYVLAQKEKMSKKAKRILYAVTSEEKADNIVGLAALSNSAFTKFVSGQIVEAFIIGILCYFGMLILGMPYATVVSVVIGATAIIPIFGAFIGAAIGAVLILAVDLSQALWFVVFIVVLQQLETNLIYPKVVGKSIGLPGILVLAAVTIGGALFGLPGIVLGIPVCSVAYCIFDAFVSVRLNSKGEHIERKTRN